MLDRQGDWPELETSEDEMTDLLTALHLSVMLLDLKIRMMEAIEEDRFDLAMTYHLLILVRQDELEAQKWAMSPKAWAIYETIHPGKKMSSVSGWTGISLIQSCLCKRCWGLTLTSGRLSF